MATPIAYHLERNPAAGSLEQSFTAPSDAVAQTVAQSYATLFTMPIYLIRIDTGVLLGSYLPPGSAPPAWLASQARTVGAAVQPTVANGLMYSCITAGTTAGTQPTWPTTLGATVTDGSVVWICNGPLASPSGVTVSPY